MLTHCWHRHRLLPQKLAVLLYMDCTNLRIILKLLSVAVRKMNNTFSPQFGRGNRHHTDHPFRCNQFRGELMCVSIMHETLLAFIALLSQMLESKCCHYLPAKLSNNSLAYDYRQRAIEISKWKYCFWKQNTFPLLAIPQPLTQPEISFLSVHAHGLMNRGNSVITLKNKKIKIHSIIFILFFDYR